MTPKQRPDSPTQSEFSAKPLFGPTVVPWPVVLAWGLVLGFLASRLWNLGVKPLHHDESLFAYYGYNLAMGNGYNYMPILHGPVLQFASAVFFVLFGDSHFVMRLPAALGGLGMAVAFWAWRGELARAAGLDWTPRGARGWLMWVPVVVALGLLAVSPSITFYSRFLRNDAPYLAATVACALFTLRAFRDGCPRNLTAAILFAALMFSMMESSIFFFVACLGYLAAIVLMELVRGAGSGVGGVAEDGVALPGVRGGISLDRWMFAIVTAAPAAGEVAARLPMTWPDWTSFLFAWLGLAGLHGLFLRQGMRAGTLCADILGAMERWSGWLVGLFAVAGLVLVLPHVVGESTPEIWRALSGGAPFAAFGFICVSLFVGCAALVQSAGDVFGGKSGRGAGGAGEGGAVASGLALPPVSMLVQCLQAILLAGLGTALLSWLYWRIFMDTVPVGAPFEVVFAGLGAPISLACGLLALVLTGLFFLYLREINRPAETALGRFAHTLHRGRFAIALSLAISIFFYQAVFTTMFTHTVDRTFNHTVRDFTEPTAPLTPVQIYKNTWDYWWDQHKEHRIKGPFHYYLPILGLYEWPGMLLVLGGVGAFLLRATPRRKARMAFLIVPHGLIAAVMADYSHRIDWNWMDVKFHVTHPFHVHLALLYLQTQFVICPLLWRARRRVESFVLFWTVTQIFAYSYAGEKVPWLSIHTAGPLLLLAGVYGGRLVAWLGERVEWDGRRVARRFAVWGVAAGLVFVWQAKSMISACFLWPHSPRERIVFNHTTPDVEWAVEQVERLRMVTGQGGQLSMFIDGEMAWPLYWYFRHTPEAFNRGDETLATTRRPVIICDWAKVAETPHIAEGYRVFRLKVREWWEPGLLNFHVMADIHLALTVRESRQREGTGLAYAMRLQAAQKEWTKLIRHLLYREIFLDPANADFSHNGNEFCLAIRKDLDPSPKYEYLSEAPFRRDIPTVR